MARYSQEHKDATRRRIIETAGRRLKRDGIDGSGIATLMADAGLTNGAFYAHFDSKDDLVATVVGEELGRQATAFGELPPGRQKIVTRLLTPDERPLAYEKIRREVAKGGQAFVICPLVEDSPNLEARAATAEYERLQTGELAGLRLALLHGRMRPADKDRVMREFRDREHDVLVSTAVVEVGVDIPNASVIEKMGIERAPIAVFAPTSAAAMGFRQLWADIAARIWT